MVDTVADSPLAQRLSRVEDLLERLADQVLPNSRPRRADDFVTATASSAGSTPLSTAPSTDQAQAQAQETTCNSLLRGLTQTTDRVPSSVPNITSAVGGFGSCKHSDISRRLASVYPPASEIAAVMDAHGDSPSIFRYSVQHDDTCSSQDLRVLFGPANILGPSSHPALIANQLAQLTLLFQQAIVARTHASPGDHALAAHASEMATAVTHLVTSNDDLVGSLEGLETICLISLYHSNFGNLRKAWLGFRRAITVAQLMGLDRPRDAPIHCIDTSLVSIPKAHNIWFQINFSDRYNSLLLGMPAANDDSWFAGSMSADESSPTAHLERTHCIVSGKIIKRNHNRTVMTPEEISSIEEDLDEAARSMGLDWWRVVAESASVSASPSSHVNQMQYIRRAMMQVNHYHLLILLHLPNMIKNVKELQYEHSRAVCMRSCRELLTLFRLFRVEHEGAAICRHTDYTALTASLTLLLGYLDPRMRANDWAVTKTRDADRLLIRDVRNVFQQMGEAKGDKLALEAHKIIGRLVPLAEIDQMGTAESEMEPLTLDIPYLGTINIKPVLRPTGGGSGGSHDESQQVSRNPKSLSTGLPSHVAQLSTPPHQHQPQPDCAIGGLGQRIPQASSCDGRALFGGNDAAASASTGWDNSGGNNNRSSDFLTPPQHQGGCDPMLSFVGASGAGSAGGGGGGYENMVMPDFSAEMDQWTFQGVDAAFFESFIGDVQLLG